MSDAKRGALIGALLGVGLGSVIVLPWFLLWLDLRLNP